MIIFKRIDKPYMEPECVKSVIDYIFRNNGNVNTYIGGLNIIEPINAAEEFNMVKSYYGKTAGTQLRHYIVSLEPKDHCIPYMAAELAYLICAYYGDRYQSVFSVHSNTNYLHVHIIVNSVSFVDGKKLHENIGDFVKLEKYCNTCYARIKGKYSYISKKLKTF